MNDIGAGRIAEIRKGKNCAKLERKMRYGQENEVWTKKRQNT